MHACLRGDVWTLKGLSIDLFEMGSDTVLRSRADLNFKNADGRAALKVSFPPGDDRSREIPKFARGSQI